MKILKNKLVLAALLTLIILATFSSLPATETRVGSMGGIGLYTHDNSNIFFFPGAIYTYAGQVVGELRVKGNDNSYSIGVHYPLNNYSVLGVYLNRPINVFVPAGIADSVQLNHTTDIFYGRQMADYDLGIRLAIGLDSYKEDLGTTDDKQSARYIGLGAGLSNERMDLGLLFELPHAKREIADSSNTWSGFGFGLNARMFSGEATKLVPLGTFYYASATTKIDRVAPPVAKVNYKRMDVGLGIGLNHQLNEQNLLVIGLEAIGLTSLKTDVDDGPESTDQSFTFPGLYMGVESEIKPWLTGRLGAAQVYQSRTLKFKPAGGTETKSTSRSSQFNVSFGLGFNFGDFVLDAAINEGLFFDGPNFISGGTNPMANRLSLTYNF
jgi:hypothetical protein